jgi:Heterokaryon incompatibility protein (HET)
MASPKSTAGLSAAHTNAEFLEELETLMEHEFFNHTTSAKHRNGEQSLGSAQSYSYKPLATKGAIRLFCLMPGTGNDKLKGSLQHILLNKHQGYEALSYAWGSQDKPCYITLPQGTLPITKSLYTALIRLRRQGEGKILWIDAICIDQANNAEKSQQILLMPRIYSAASCVLVWLGEDEGNGKAALQLLEKISRTDFSSLPARQISAEWMQAHGLPSQDNPLWHALLAFWQRSWFRRAWVVPEFVMARDVLMICGSWEVSWKNLDSAIEKMTDFMLLHWGTFPKLGVERDVNVASAGYMALLAMLRMKQASHMGPLIAKTVRDFSERELSGLQELHEERWSHIPFIKHLVMIFRILPNMTQGMTELLENLIDGCSGVFGEPQTRIKFPLLNLLPSFERTEATDPRDKLFALLGLAEDGDDKALRPNYDESTESILLRYARAFVKNGHGMQMLYQAGIAGRDTQIPSWVPDWTQADLSQSRMLFVRAMTGLSYAAASDASTQIRLTKVQEELIVSGSYLDTVSRTLQFPSPYDDNGNADFRYIAELQAFFAEADDIVLNREAYVTGEPLFEVQWRTLVGNLGARPHIAPEEFGLEYRACRQAIDESRLGDVISLDTPNQYLRKLLPLLLRYKLCETQSGLVGMVPVDARVRDVIYLFAGSRMPFVLRPCDEDESKYQIIGVCYVHGMMNGEALRSEKWKEEDICMR